MRNLDKDGKIKEMGTLPMVDVRNNYANKRFC